MGLNESVWLTDDVSGNVHHVLNANPNPIDDSLDRLPFGYYTDVSPAGDKVAYTSCEFPQNVAAGGKYPAVLSEVGPPSANYDIVVGELGVDVDGRQGIISNTRITKTTQRIDHYPVWSPDGTWIASLSMDRTPTPHELSLKVVLAQNLDVWRADGSSKVPTVLVSTLERFDDRLPSSSGIALIPPVWSPDGRHIAYYLVVKKDSKYTYELYTTGVANLPNLSKSGRHRIGTTTSALETIPPRPSWSPDGQRIAFVADDGTNRGLFIAQADGTEQRQVASDPEIREIAWSPDGSEILFVVTDEVYFINPDGTDRRRLELSPALGEGAVRLVVWSPDGSRIAILRTGGGPVVLTVAPDGSDVRILGMGDKEGRLQSTDDWRRAEISACSRGTAVPEPKANPNLVLGCATLLLARDALRGTAELNWTSNRPLDQWDGLYVSGWPQRIFEIALNGRGLTGEIPPVLGELTHLRRLNLSGNKLSGAIPPELGQLTQLARLDVSDNSLTGSIPRELGALTHLVELRLNNNQLTGPIPLEVGQLANLEFVFLRVNGLTGCIPPALLTGPRTDLHGLRLPTCEPG